MIRDWIRALRRKGIAAFFMPIRVIVMMVYGYVEYVDNYLAQLDEVSIGHALICDAVYLGLENTIRLYLNKLV